MTGGIPGVVAYRLQGVPGGYGAPEMAALTIRFHGGLCNIYNPISRFRGGTPKIRGGGLSESTDPKIGEKNVANFAAVTSWMRLYRER